MEWSWTATVAFFVIVWVAVKMDAQLQRLHREVRDLRTALEYEIEQRQQLDISTSKQITALRKQLE